MTSADDSNDDFDLASAQEVEKLEWVTPKISLMGTDKTEGKNTYSLVEEPDTLIPFFGPS